MTLLSRARRCFSHSFNHPCAMRLTSSSPRYYASKKESSSHPHYPGAPNARFVHEMQFVREREPFPVYCITDTQGRIINEKDYKECMKYLSNDDIKNMYRLMVQLETMDYTLYNSQRQGRISFYMTNFGEEATHFGTAAALDAEDEVFAQYREAGVLLYRGYTIDECLAQCLGTKDDPGKGRQMPIHYGAKHLHFQTISSPLGTQIPHASGAGYALKREGKKNVAACYFGEGAASEGDFHAALNFASTLNCQTMFFCRNNGYAISTPTHDQYRGDGIAARGPAYGIDTIRVDGNDLFAVYMATRRAREICINQQRPILIEFMTYRVGHHSTSDDSSRYREQKEIDFWKTEHSPIARIRNYLVERKLWTEDEESQLREHTQKEVLSKLQQKEQEELVPISELITDVYDDIPEMLQEQKHFVDQIVEKYPEAYSNK